MTFPPEIWKTGEFHDISSVYKQNTTEKTTKGSILPFPKKGGLEISKNYLGITLTSIVAKVYNTLYQTWNWKIPRKNQNVFRRNQATTSQILTIRRIIEGGHEKKSRGNTIF